MWVESCWISLNSGWSTVYLRLLLKGWPPCLPVIVMVACPGSWAEASTCQVSSVLLSVNAWPLMLADSSVNVVIVAILAGWP